MSAQNTGNTGNTGNRVYIILINILINSIIEPFIDGV